MLLNETFERTARQEAFNNGIELFPEVMREAGGPAEAVYARGALAIRKKDYNTARRYLSKAKEMGFEKAGRTLDELNERLQ